MNDTTTAQVHKPRVEIQNWSISDNRLHGDAINHPHLGSDRVRTSTIVMYDEEAGTVETANTIYVLVGDSMQPVAGQASGRASTVGAMGTLKAAMQADQGYAWGWQCNLAMSFYDAAGNTPNKHRIANEGAVRFMRSAFDVDVTQFPEYHALVKGWTILEAVEPGLPKPGETWTHRKGERYMVLGVTSVPEVDKAAKFPRTVFYQGPDGRKWTRTLDSWNESFTRGERPKYDPATQPGSPEFDGAEAYEAHLAATVGDTGA